MFSKINKYQQNSNFSTKRIETVIHYFRVFINQDAKITRWKTFLNNFFLNVSLKSKQSLQRKLSVGCQS